MGTGQSHWVEEHARSIAPRRQFWLPLAICIAVSMFAACVYELWRIAREPRWTDLGLDAVRRGGDIELTWDVKSPSVILAKSGELVITDGSEQNHVQLTRDMLRTGRVTYTPTHDDLRMRLELYSGNIRTAGDALRLIGTAKSETAQEVERPVQPARSQSAPQQPKGEASRDTSALDSVAVVAPEPVRQVRPDIPEGIRSRMDHDVTVPVEVHINANGKVTSAVAHKEGDTVTRFLAAEAEKAARSWQFTPAKTKSGRKVASSRTIQFTFQP